MDEETFLVLKELWSTDDNVRLEKRSLSRRSRWRRQSTCIKYYWSFNIRPERPHLPVIPLNHGTPYIHPNFPTYVDVQEERN